ncbi:hypothetical protein [Streptomyces agglomeratus]|uniref:hypothetical protein n=1 Tax=Streptomyces agglomeratus TaxID=285458 RepID=UPI000A4F1B19
MAIQYHTARFRLVPQLAKTLSVPTPAVRKPGSTWTELPRPMNAGRRTGRARPPRLRPRLDRPAVPRRTVRLPRRSRDGARVFS